MQPVRWTMVGDVKSGKSYFVHSSLRALSVSSVAAVYLPDETSRKLEDRMTEHMRKGKLDATSGGIIEYKFQQKAAPGQDARDVCIVDGPGKALYLDHATTEAVVSRETSEAYRAAAFGSDALVVILPLASPSAPDTTGWVEVVRQFVGSLHQHAEKRLKRIAVCISKVDQADGFEEAVAAANFKAFTQDVLSRADSGGRVGSAIRNFLSMQDGLQVSFFPVSSFGIVRGTNRRNVIPETDLPLVNHIQFDVRPTCLGTPLYPRPFHEKEVNDLWKPFNVEAPFRFLLTGEMPEGSGLLMAEIPSSD